MNKRKWLRSMYYTYFPLFVICTLMIVGVAVLAIRDLLNIQVAQANKVYARQVMETIDYSLKSIDRSVIKEIQMNNEMDEFLNNVNSSVFLANDVGNQFLDIKINNPIVESIYLYRVSDGMVLSQAVMLPVERFEDAAFIEASSKGDVEGRWLAARKYRVDSITKTEKDVVSLIRKVPLLSGGLGMIIVNVNVSAMEALIRESNVKELGFFNLLDRQGGMLLEMEPEQAVIQVNSHMIAAVQSAYTGWTIQYGLMEADLYAYILSGTYQWVIYAGFIILVGLTVLSFSIRRNYKPIEHITSQIYRLDAEAQSGKDEIQFIELALGRFVQQASIYKEQYDKDLYVRRKHFFQMTIEGIEPGGEEAWIEQSKQFGMPFGGSRFLVSVYEINKYVAFCEEYDNRDQQLLKYAMSNVLGELAVEQGLSLWGEWLTDQQLTLLFHIDGEQSNISQKVAFFSENGREWIQKHLKFTISAGIGSEIAGIAGISLSYLDALKALKYKSTLGLNRVIDYGEVPSVDPEMRTYLQRILALADSCRVREEQWTLRYDELFDKLEEKPLQHDEVMQLLQYLTYQLHLEMSGLSAEYRIIWMEQTYPRIKLVVQELETIAEARAAIFGILKEAIEAMNQVRESHANRQQLQKIREYIEEHYDDLELSLTKLSEEFGWKDKYISQLFKAEFGEKFNDYLTEIRISKAKQLLLETEQTIPEIAMKVGYVHSFSFTRAFKKLTGLTPGEFRKSRL